MGGGVKNWPDSAIYKCNKYPENNFFMEDPITPIVTTIILMAFPIVTAYAVDYLYILSDKITNYFKDEKKKTK